MRWGAKFLTQEEKSHHLLLYGAKGTTNTWRSGSLTCADQPASWAKALSAGSATMGNHGIIFRLERKWQWGFSSYKVCIVWFLFTKSFYVPLCDSSAVSSQLRREKVSGERSWISVTETLRQSIIFAEGHWCFELYVTPGLCILTALKVVPHIFPNGILCARIL